MGERLKIQSEPDYIREPETPKSAEVVYLKNFVTYSALPGAHLEREEYERVTKAAEKPGAKVNETSAINANTYARHAKITLLPESSLKLYSILVSDNDISSDLLHGDQQRLAEVLRMEGKVADAEKLIDAYSPIIKF